MADRAPNDAPGPGDARGDRRGGGLPARGRARRHADRDGLRPRGRRDLGRRRSRRIYAAKGRPVFNPLIAHVARRRGGAGARAVRRRRRAARARLLAGAADAGAAGRADLPRQPARPGGARYARAARAGPSGRPRADRGGRAAARRALGQPLRPRQSDHGRPRARRPRRPDRLDPRRRAFAGTASNRPSSPASTPARRCCVPGASPREAIEAALGRPLSRRPSRAPPRPTRRGSSPPITRRARACGSTAADVGPDEAALDFGGALAGVAPRGRASTFRRRAISSRRRPICSPTCGRSTQSGAAAIAVAPIPRRGLGAAINDRLRRAAAPRRRREQGSGPRYRRIQRARGLRTPGFAGAGWRPGGGSRFRFDGRGAELGRIPAGQGDRRHALAGRRGGAPRPQPLDRVPQARRARGGGRRAAVRALALRLRPDRRGRRDDRARQPDGRFDRGVRAPGRGPRRQADRAADRSRRWKRSASASCPRSWRSSRRRTRASSST